MISRFSLQIESTKHFQNYFADSKSYILWGFAGNFHYLKNDTEYEANYLCFFPIPPEVTVLDESRDWW